MAKWRIVVGVAAVAVALSACSPNKGSGSSSATTLINGKPYDSSAFCAKAREATKLEQATQNLDLTDTTGVKKAFDASFNAAKDNAANAPASLKTDYATYVSWLTQLNAGLAQHGYKMTETLTDEALVKLADDETIKTATDKVTAYVQTTCGAGIYETTTTSSIQYTVPTVKK